MFEAEVARGAALLDARAPGWEGKIDVGRLSMESCSRCVLGQTFGDFAAGMYSLGIGYRCGEDYQGGAHGFDGLSGASVQDWDALRDTWAALIKERFDTGNLSGVTA